MLRRSRLRRRLLLAMATTSALVAVGISATPAFAQAPWWRLSSRPAPTYLRHGDKEDEIVVAANNVGDADVQGSKASVTMTDTLPKGLTATAISGRTSFQGGNGQEGEFKMTCLPLPALRCEYSRNLPPYERLEVKIIVVVGSGASSGEQNQVKVEGGEAPGASLSRPITVSDQATPFGIEEGGFELIPESDGGSLDTEAGSHPFQVTSAIDLDESLQSYAQRGNEGLATLQPSAPALVKDLSFILPPGLVGNPNAVPACSNVDFSTLLVGDTNLCPSDTAVGVASVTLNVPVPLGFDVESVPVFNLEPSVDEPARFGFEVDNVPVILDTSVLTGGDYGVVITVENASQAGQVLGGEVTLWGVPGDPRHDASRGWACVEGGVHALVGESCEPPNPRSTEPFVTLPTSCPKNPVTQEPEPMKATISADSWLEPGRPQTASAKSVGLEGCNELSFDPSISVEPGTHAASTPTGLTVDVHVPQQSTMEAQGRAEAAVKDTTVAFPPGMELSPAAADGLEACAEGETGVGFSGFAELEAGTPTATFTEKLPVPLEPGRNFCPNASKVGVVHVKTPLLSHELEGGVYLAAQNANPFGSLVAMYIVAEDPVSHVLAKFAGEVTLDEHTLQVVSTFKNTPQVPFEDLKVELFGGPRASVTTPPSCGSYATAASFVPWSGSAASNASSPPFTITSGPGGTPCANPQPFAPGFTAQTTNVQAGAFTPFTLAITRPDADQAVSGVSVHMPPGVAALLSSVTPCPEPQASQGTCGAESLIGHTTVSAGLGPQPFTTPVGQVFITGPYEGAPFGLSIVAPAVAGPFNLGNVIVRSRITVDPSTAAVTVSSDPLPTQLKGIPLQLQHINVTIDRPGFEFNPTNCNPTEHHGDPDGAQGATSNVSSPFQVANCGALAFKPVLTASAGGRASKAGGTSFVVRVQSGGVGPGGEGQANIAKVDLQLPKALPARLTTIQKACVAAVFEANPAACGEGSLIGTATIHTPVLKSPLSGPAYLVSHGGAAFPDVEFVLQGEGVTVILDGKTDIKAGVTYSRFESAPDAPFTSFETVLPAGPHSALTANVPEKQAFDLCGAKLSAPTEITAQDGVLIKQDTPIALTGCGGVKGVKARKLTRAQKLAKALKACRKKHSHSRRAACERQAHKQYGAKKAARRHATRK